MASRPATATHHSLSSRPIKLPRQSGSDTLYVCVAYEARTHSLMEISHGTSEGFTKRAGLTGSLVRPRGPFHTTVRILLFHEFLSLPSFLTRGATSPFGNSSEIGARDILWGGSSISGPGSRDGGLGIPLPYRFALAHCSRSAVIRSSDQSDHLPPFSPRLASLSQPKPKWMVERTISAYT